MKSKKVILFIVEGLSDQDALNPILKNIFQNEDIRFHVVHGDVTSDFATSSSNVVKMINQHIEVEKNRYGFTKNDIIKVIHLIDTDGTFIPADNVIRGSTELPQYFDDRIESKNPNGIIRRNERKSLVLRRLYTVSTVAQIPYRVYYFSRNLEHVLHNNNADLTDDEKFNYADAFAEKYKSDQEGFKKFISSREFAVDGEYKDTWAFIMEGINSLHRYCNFHLLFQQDGQAE